MDDVLTKRPTRALAALLASGLLLAGCSGGEDEPEADASSTPTESASESTSASPAGDDVTSAGTQLVYGDTATVEYEAKGRTALLDLTVKSAEEGALGDFSGFDTEDPLVRNASFYYVRVQVENAGKKAFGSAEVPLWGISGANTLLPPVKFTSSFKTCPTETLPASFKPGAKFSTCLVFLSPRKGKLEGVSYRPTVDVTPIEWRGDVEKDAPKKKSADKKSGAKKKGSGQG
ncbi:hypothetical protein G7072_05495 [Nocardioides sp. HDW12B]|uniref:hypothetical protein n=1 Tax=Nocardioides sp. HDW12B TaxID=2714939 RepID=UPI00140B32AA|nr:hypothetical protein [Nocardioides sp. HDW12B]QIK65858.1 hypothetical protein G7072_05495 [Nocardioides sp. HDW12B]